MKLTQKQSYWLSQLQRYGSLTTPPNGTDNKTFEALVRKGVAKVIKTSKGYTTYDVVKN